MESDRSSTDTGTLNWMLSQYVFKPRAVCVCSETIGQAYAYFPSAANWSNQAAVISHNMFVKYRTIQRVIVCAGLH